MRSKVLAVLAIFAVVPWLVAAGNVITSYGITINLISIYADDITLTNDLAVGNDLTVVGTSSLGVTSVSTLTATKTVYTPATPTCADSGDGNPATCNVTTTSANIYYTCSDADGCALTLLETNATSGAEIFIMNVSANNLTIADSAGVQETTGSLTLGQLDNVRFIYSGSAWVQSMAVTNVS